MNFMTNVPPPQATNGLVTFGSNEPVEFSVAVVNGVGKDSVLSSSKLDGGHLMLL